MMFCHFARCIFTFVFPHAQENVMGEFSLLVDHYFRLSRSLKSGELRVDSLKELVKEGEDVGRGDDK